MVHRSDFPFGLSRRDVPPKEIAMSTNFRPLIFGGALAAIALTFVSVGAYRKYHKPAPVPVPIAYVAPKLAVVEPKKPEVTPPPPAAKPVVKHEPPKERRYKSKGKRRGDDVKARVKAPEPPPRAKERHRPRVAPGGDVAKAPPVNEADALAKLQADSHGGKKLSCREVLNAVKVMPDWLLKKFEATATPEQKERGKKCLGIS
jgi:hypothetical protein